MFYRHAVETGIGTAAIALISFAALWRFKVSEPVLVLAAGLIGLILWPDGDDRDYCRAALGHAT